MLNQSLTPSIIGNKVSPAAYPVPAPDQFGAVTGHAGLVATEFPGLEVERTATRFEDNRNYQVSTEKARDDLGFRPAIQVCYGIREVKRLLDEQRLALPDHPRYWNDRHLASQKEVHQ